MYHLLFLANLPQTLEHLKILRGGCPFGAVSVVLSADSGFKSAALISCGLDNHFFPTCPPHGKSQLPRTMPSLGSKL